MDRWRRYRQLREKEAWVLDDKRLRLLPEVPTGDAHAEAWKFRGNSLRRFQRYLKRNLAPGGRILDLGAGNGWITHALYLQGYDLLGLEPGTEDIDQARRVFGEGQRLRWQQGDLYSLPRTSTFDLVLLAASVQYFPDLSDLCQHLEGRLNKGGSIHLLDSRLYPESEINAARQRSRDYYAEIGFPEMADFYFHHSREEAKNLGFRKKWPLWPFSDSLQWWCRKL